jgi:hypothetical protein
MLLRILLMRRFIDLNGQPAQSHTLAFSREGMVHEHRADDLCPTHLPGESAGHPNLPPGGPAQALSHGLPQPGLITTARTLYATEAFGVELDQAAYALDATIIDLCLALFP